MVALSKWRYHFATSEMALSSKNGAIIGEKGSKNKWRYQQK